LFFFFNENDLVKFISKFRGSLLFKGRSSLSYKLLDKILYFLKKKYKKNSIFVFKKSVLNLLPLVGIRNIKVGKKVLTLPFPLKNYRRFMLVNKWIIKNSKNKGNIRGINLMEICKSLNDSYLKRGPILKMKKDYLQLALNSRYLLHRKKKEDYY